MNNKLNSTFTGRADPIFVVRHAHSLGQADPSTYKTIGDKKLPITEIGHAQAISAADYLRALFVNSNLGNAEIIHSECLRTTETAEDIAKVLLESVDINQLVDGRINKQEFGLFDGLLTKKERAQTLPELAEKYENDFKVLGPLKVAPPGGESLQEVIDRVRFFLQDTALRKGPKIIVTHGLQALCIQKVLENKSDEWLFEQQDSISNCAIRVFNRNAQGQYKSECIYDGDHRNAIPHVQELGTSSGSAEYRP